MQRIQISSRFMIIQTFLEHILGGGGRKEVYSQKHTQKLIRCFLSILCYMYSNICRIQIILVRRGGGGVYFTNMKIFFRMKVRDVFLSKFFFLYFLRILCYFQHIRKQNWGGGVL